MWIILSKKNPSVFDRVRFVNENFSREIFSRGGFTNGKYHRERIPRYEKITRNKIYNARFRINHPVKFHSRHNTLQKWHWHPVVLKKTWLFLSPPPLVRRSGELTSKISIESQHNNSNRRYDDNSLAATEWNSIYEIHLREGRGKKLVKGCTRQRRRNLVTPEIVEEK